MRHPNDPNAVKLRLRSLKNAVSNHTTSTSQDRKDNDKERLLTGHLMVSTMIMSYRVPDATALVSSRSRVSPFLMARLQACSTVVRFSTCAMANTSVEMSGRVSEAVAGAAAFWKAACGRAGGQAARPWVQTG
jgi:hypothetical protein